MTQIDYKKYSEKSLEGTLLSKQDCRVILRSREVELISLLNSAFDVRSRFWGKEVTIHIINNAQNGFCPEDCKYCAQAKTSDSPIKEYPVKSEEEILNEARNAYEKGAHRYCLVFAGRGPSNSRIEFLSNVIRKIKSKYPIEVCVSAGLLDEKKAFALKDAGLDRLNHNLNTSQSNYANICSTHTFQDRINTLKAAKNSGLQLCSGAIIGLNELDDDIIEMAITLRQMEVESIPVNFLIPVEGNKMDLPRGLSPEYCLRVLCLFRFLNPKAEIRVAAGREYHLRSMEVMSLYPANSLFMDGYLNVKGSGRLRTYQMINDAGFTISSDKELNDLIEKEQAINTHNNFKHEKILMKDINDLRPEIQVS